MKGKTTLTISREELCDAITFWLNNQIMKHPHKCISLRAADGMKIAEIEIEPIQPDGAEPIHPKGKEDNLWLEKHGGD